MSYWFLSVLFYAFSSHADCASPTGVEGAIQFNSPSLDYCDGNSWQPMQVTDTGLVCVVGEQGVFRRSGNDFVFCNGSTWISVDGVSTGVSCPVSDAGKMEWRNNRVEWCNGSLWKLATSDPCAGVAIGQPCLGTAALFAGTYDGSKYMIMPSGCADDTSNPACAGADTTTKIWRGSSGTFSDIPSLANIASPSTASSQKGDQNTPIIVAHSSISSDSTADYCNNMVFGGYSDWSLPAKSELAYIYCKSSPSAHNTSYPQENVNCGGSGPTNQITGFSGSYATSAEYNNQYAYRVDFDTGNVNILSKAASAYVRCVRRY